LYDSTKHFIEKCALYIDSWRGFSNSTDAIDFLSVKDRSLWAEYRDWLKSVLYLNTIEPRYFCACVEEIRWTYWGNQNAFFAVDQWLINNTSCDSATIRRDYVEGRRQQYEYWLQHGDTTKALDTILPSMHELGLDTLLARHFLLNTSDRVEHILTSAIASPNPTKEGVVITFGLQKSSYVHIQLYDVLGTEVSSTHFEALFEVGNQAVPISLHDLPSGTYYARVITSPGDSRMVKLVKE
jgi:hypothetical protein